MSFDWDAYLKRVELTNIPSPDEAGLRSLHNGQFYNIPFENFDIQLGRGITVEPGDVFDKLVNHRRGGYCFELNGLMLQALQATGFQARPILARVHLGPQPSGLTHQMSVVEIGERPWLMDVGFGAGGLRCPLPLEVGHSEETAAWGFRLVADERWGVMMQSREKGVWKNSYSFDLSAVLAADIEVGNHFTSTSQASHFVTSRIASLPVAGGRVSLLDFDFINLNGDKRTTTRLADDASYLDVLVREFNIDLGAPYSDLRILPSEG